MIWQSQDIKFAREYYQKSNDGKGIIIDVEPIFRFSICNHNHFARVIRQDDTCRYYVIKLEDKEAMVVGDLC